MLIMAATKIKEETGYDYLDNLMTLNAILNSKPLHQLIYELRFRARFKQDQEPYPSDVGC